MHKSIAVIGTVFVDYKGFANESYKPLGRNLGRVEVVPGGVARNVAVNLKHLHIDTWFLGTINKDGSGDILKEKMNSYGIRLDYLQTVPCGGTGMWLVLLDHNGDLLGSVSHMPDYEVMEAAIIPQLPNVFSNVAGIAFEIDLSDKIAYAVLSEAKKQNCKVYVLPGNFSVIGKNYDMFQDIECFICNETEAGLLFGKEISNKDDLIFEMKCFADKYKLNNFVVTLGDKGSVFIDEKRQSGFQPIYETKVIDSTGAGDAFFSASVAALINGKSLKDAVQLGAKIASLVISAKESDCACLADEMVKEHAIDWCRQ